MAEAGRRKANTECCNSEFMGKQVILWYWPDTAELKAIQFPCPIRLDSWLAGVLDKLIMCEIRYAFWSEFTTISAA